MVMGKRIKTRQQLFDDQADVAEHMNHDRAEVQGGVDAVRQELAELRERMAVIKQEAAVEVDRKWTSPWRTPDVFDLKVKTRLTSHPEYRTLQGRVREAEANLAAEAGASTEVDTAK